MHREEGDVERDDGPPEVQTATRFVVHHAGPFRCPVVEAGEHCKQRAGYQHVVEVRHHVVTILQLNINRCDRQNQTGETTHGEHEDEAHCKQHWGFKGHRTFPHGCEPVEDFHARRHRDQHGGVHEEQLTRHRHTGGVHVVRPHDERQNRDRGSCVHHRRVAKQLLARERWHNLADDAERRQNHDVHLRVSEEPEDVLEHHRITTAGWVKESGTEVTVGQRHSDRTSQHRHHSDQQVGCDQPSPDEHRHLHQRHARSAHVKDGDHDVDRAHDR